MTETQDEQIVAFSLLRTEDEIMQNWKGDISTPVVSVCTITYNHEAFIAEAIESFLMQETDFPFELVIDEDCSTDGTADVIRKYAEKYPNIIKANLRDKNVGMMVNGTENLERAKGEYIVICEGDDYWTDNNKLQIQIDLMDKYPECNISIHRATVRNEDSRKILNMANYGDEIKVISLKEIIESSGQFAPTSSYCIRNHIITTLPDWFYAEAPIGDFFLEVYGAKNAGCLYIPNNMSVYRVFARGSWSENILRTFSKNELVFNQKMEEVLEKMKDDFDEDIVKSIEIKQSHSILKQSEYYLHNKQYKLFRKKISKAYLYSKKNNERINYLYQYRNFPLIFSQNKTLLKIKSILRRIVKK